MPVEVAIDLTYALYGVLFTGAAFDWTLLVDPWGLWTSPGRPRDQATEQVITRLSTSRNPAARLWAVELDKGLINFGLVISTGGSGRTILNAWFSQFVDNMMAQGVNKVHAQEIGVNAMSRAAQAGSPLEPELREPLAAGLTFNGPQSVADQFLKGIDYWKGQGFVGQQLLTKAENWTLNHSTVAELTQLKIGQPSDTKPVLPVLPTTPGTCQAGFSYDPTTQLCWPTPPPSIPPTIPPFPGPGPQPNPNPNPFPNPLPTPTPTPSSDNDELGDYGDAILQSLQDIKDALGNQNGGTNEECCQNIVAGLGGIVGAITAILSSLPTGGGSNVVNIDLGPVVDAIGQLVTVVQNIAAPGAPGAPVDLTETNAQLAAIAEAISAGQGDNPALDQIAADADPDGDAFVQQLVADGALDAATGSIIRGQP